MLYYAVLCYAILYYTILDVQAHGVALADRRAQPNSIHRIVFSGYSHDIVNTTKNNNSFNINGTTYFTYRNTSAITNRITKHVNNTYGHDVIEIIDKAMTN